MFTLVFDVIFEEAQRNIWGFGMFGPWWQGQGGVEKYIAHMAHIPNMDLSLTFSHKHSC
jgi:hypothetical protein